MPVGATYTRSLPDMKAWDKANDAAKHVAPKYSMRAKTSFGAQIKKKMCESDKTSGPLDYGVIMHENPKWSIRKRTCKLLQNPGQTTDSVPGPGTYPVPATTTFDHPTLPMPGRTSMKGPERFPTPKQTPGPGSYDTKNFYSILSGRPPKFSMRVKPFYGGNVKKVLCHATSGPLDMDQVRNKAPAYSIRKRTCKLLQNPGQTTDSVPGPGTYPVPSTTYLDHPTMKMPGKCVMAREDRFKIRVDCVYDGAEVKVGHTARFGEGYRPHERIPK